MKLTNTPEPKMEHDSPSRGCSEETDHPHNMNGNPPHEPEKPQPMPQQSSSPPPSEIQQHAFEQQAVVAPVPRFVDQIGSIVTPYGVPGYQIRVLMFLEAIDPGLALPEQPQQIQYQRPVHAVAECGSLVTPARPGFQIRVAMYLECVSLTPMPQALFGVPVSGSSVSRDGREAIGNSFPNANP